MDILIRKETEADRFETEAVTRRSFWNKFGPGCNEHLLVHTMRGKSSWLPELSRVAEVDGHIAGVIMYFKAKIIKPDGSEMVVPSFGPLCTDHAFKNRGIGAALLEATLPLVREAGWSGVIIFGEPEYYPRHGFVRAGSLGLTDMEGHARDPFMAWESTPGSLRIPGGKFNEGDIGDGLTGEALEKLEQEQPYEFLMKAIRPCLWSYENACDEKDGYHLMYAVQSPRAFDSMFRTYVEELSRYDPALKDHDADEILRELREDVTKARYLIMAGGETAGLLVTSVPVSEEEAKEDGCGNYLEEIWLRPEYRGRGIAADIFRRYLRQQKTDTGFCVIPGNPAKDVWLGLLDREGYEYSLRPGEEDLLFCHIRNGKERKQEKNED
ncbi:MAG: hypothetical protein CW338_11190 [Clostridiales bacterium]|nr:hypothetical protein [Clostridiales bacterium]